MAIPPTPWIVRPQPCSRVRLRLFCFPYSGGAAGAFRTWPDYLPNDVELCAIQFPGRERRLREAPLERLGPLVTALLEALPPYLDAPFAFFGHSLGALVAFELTRALRAQQGPQPFHLFVSASRAPQLPPSHPALYQLSDEDFLRELHRYNGTPAEVLQNDELMQLLLPMLRADFAIHDTYAYTPQPPLSCPITAFGGLQDVIARPDELPPWRDQTLGAFAVQMFPGDHFFLREAEPALVGAIAAAIPMSEPGRLTTGR